MTTYAEPDADLFAGSRAGAHKDARKTRASQATQTDEPVTGSDPYDCPPLDRIASLPPELSASACLLMDDYIAWSKKVSPIGYDNFHENVFLFILSTIAARRVAYVQTDGYHYTPLMIYFVAESTVWAKSFTAHLAYTTLEQAGLLSLVTNDADTPSFFLSQRADTIPENFLQLSSKKQEGIRESLRFAGQKAWYLDEAGEIIRDIVSGQGIYSGYKTHLLRFDNCEPEYRPGTQKRGREVINKPYLALLATMTVDDLKSNPRGANLERNGFWARCVRICPPERRGEKPEKPDEDKVIPLPLHISSRLHAWHTNLGIPEVYIEETKDEKGHVTDFDVTRDDLPQIVCKKSQETKQAVRNYEKALERASAQMPLKDLAASYGRLPVHTMRAAALLAAFDNLDRENRTATIELRHWARAQEIAERWRESLHELYRQINTSTTQSEKAKQEDTIVAEMKKLIEKGIGPAFSASELRERSKTVRAYSSKEIDEILASLARGGKLEKATKPGDRTTRYEMKSSTAKQEDEEQW